MNFDEAAMKVRRGRKGIIETIPRAVLKTRNDLSTLYTPGVAQPCREIVKDKDLPTQPVKTDEGDWSYPGYPPIQQTEYNHK